LEEALDLSFDRLLIDDDDNPSGRIMALGLTQPLTEMSTMIICWGVKAAGAYG